MLLFFLGVFVLWQVPLFVKIFGQRRPPPSTASARQRPSQRVTALHDLSRRALASPRGVQKHPRKAGGQSHFRGFNYTLSGFFAVLCWLAKG